MKLQKRLLASTVRLVTLGGVAILLYNLGSNYPRYFVSDAIAASSDALDPIIQNKQNSDTSNNRRGGTGNQGFGAASARVDNPPPPPAGGNQTPGTSRDSCLTGLPLVALSPSANFGLTVSPRPTLWFYIPEISEEFRGTLTGYFGLLNSDDEPVFDEIILTLPSEAGYVGFTVPEEFELTVGENYEWYFEFNHCEESEPALSVSGWIQRVELAPELMNRIRLSDQEAYDVYLNNLLWFDIIDYFTRRRLEDPNNERLLQTWSDLLNADGIDLDKLAIEDKLPTDPILFEYQSE